MDKHAFCRNHYKAVMSDVRKINPNLSLGNTWAHRTGRNQFHFDALDYSIQWDGRACCKWNAKAKAWEEWIDRKV